MKLMAIFLMLILLYSSISLICTEAAPVYENPVIVKSNGIQGKKASVSLSAQQLRVSLNNVNTLGIQEGLRNDMIKQFSLGGLKKWVNNLSNQNLNNMSKTDEVKNLNEIQTLSISMQDNIHQTCGRISDLLKLLHLKLQEVNTLNGKINTLKPGAFKKNLSGVKKQTVELRKAMEKEKLAVQHLMNQIQQKQKKLIQTISVYDKKFASKNEGQLKDLLTALNLQLKNQMPLPYFKNAYSKFIANVLAIAKTLSPAQLSNLQNTASELIKLNWNSILQNAKANWEKSHKSNLRKKKFRISSIKNSSIR